MEMFNLTKNHKGDILISGATSKYSMSWAISEGPEADLCGSAQRADMPSLCDNLERCRLLCHRPSRAIWPSGLRSMSSHVFFTPHIPRLYQKEPQTPGGRGLLNHPEISAKWRCSRFNKLHREKLALARAGGLGSGESQGPLFRRNLPAAGLGVKAKADTMLLLLV